MSIELRQRKKGKKISLYLDCYYEGKRNYEYLKLYLFPEPENGKLAAENKLHNRNTLKLAEAIKARRMVEFQNGLYGFQDRQKAKGSFLNYMEILAEKRRDSDGNYGNWISTIKQLREFEKKDISFAEINKQWLESWQEYLKTKAKTKSEKRLSANTQFSYYSKTVAAIKEAIRDGIIKNDPSAELDRIKQEDVNREFLTYDELKKVAQYECDVPLLKEAFLFSALTGLRWGDIEKLQWGEVQHSAENGYYIRLRQEKTNGFITLPIGEQARSLLGKEKGIEDLVFEGLRYSAWNNSKIKDWISKAGIQKNITFHCARHTYATLLITKGVDIYTVSKLLGHKSIKNTEIYAKIVDEKKIEAGLSPFNPESVAIEAGRLMLSRIHELMKMDVDFAFETTLATRSYVSLVKAAQEGGYRVKLLFIWLDSPLTAIQRVADRVAEGGHNIPKDIIERRYFRGIFNLINLYIPVCDSWIVVNNKNVVPEMIAKGSLDEENMILNHYIWDVINAQSKAYGNQ